MKMSNESLIKGLVRSLLDASRSLPVVTGQSRILVNVIQGSMIFLVMRRRIVIAAAGGLDGDYVLDGNGALQIAVG